MNVKTFDGRFEDLPFFVERYGKIQWNRLRHSKQQLTKFGADSIELVVSSQCC